MWWLIGYIVIGTGISIYFLYILHISDNPADHPGWKALVTTFFSTIVFWPILPPIIFGE